MYTIIMPPRLPPTFLRTTVYTNELLGNVIVQGNIRSGFITANVIYGNVAGVSIVAQNIYGNLTSNNWTPGNVTNLNITGNMTAGYFIGNGSQLSGIAAALPGIISEDIIGNIIGTYANVLNVIATSGNIGNVIIIGGNVSGSNISGQSVFANLITFGVNANVGKMTGIYCVSMNGNDSTADGSPVKPFLTIQAAHDRALVEYPPSTGALTKQVEIRVAPGEYSSPLTITRYNTVVRGAGSLFGRGQYTTIGQVTVNCANAAYVFNNTVGLDRVLCTNGVTNTGNGAYTLNIDSCYLTANTATPLSSENDKSYVYVNDSFVSATLAGGNTYVRSTGNSLYLYDCTIQASSGISSGRFIDVGGNCVLTIERCYVNAVSSPTAIITASSSVPSALAGFKINVTNSYLQNIGGPGIDFGTTATAGSFIRDTTAISPSSNVFVGNGIAYQNELIILPGTSNSGVSTVSVTPYTTYSTYYTLPGIASLDIRGNVIGSYANVTTLIGTTGNVGNVRMVGGNVALSGQINALGNIVAPFFVGNGSRLTGIATYTLPGSAAIDITGNQIGSYANVTTLIGATGNVGNIRMVGGNVAVSGQVNVLGNVVAPFFVGNGSQLTGIAQYVLPGSAAIDITGNHIGSYANVTTLIATSATISSAGNANVLTVSGTTTNTIGSLIQATTLRGNSTAYSVLRLDTTGGRLLDINGNGEMSLTSATNDDIMNISTRTGTFAGNALSIVVPRLSFTEYSFISCRNTNGQLFNVDGRGVVTAQCAVNGNVVNVVSSSATNTNDMIRIQSSASAAQPFNMISAKNSAGNVFRVSGSGAVFGVGAYNTSGADYAEMFEWEDGNTNDEDRRGVTVVKGNNGVIRMATGVDDPATIFGVVSTNPSIVGDTKWDEWSGRYLRDRFGSKLSNAVYYIANVSNENERIRCASTAKPPKGYEKIVSSEFIENPAYDPNVAYVAREARREWATVGLVGKLLVLPDQVVNPNWILFRNIFHPDGDILEYIVK